MGEENEHEEELEDEEDLEDEEGDDNKKVKPVRMSQENFTEAMKRERSKGKRIARREVLRELGVRDMDELKSKMAAPGDRTDDDDLDKNKESEKARRDTEKAQRERDEARAEAAQVRLEANVERALLAADVPAKQVARVARMIVVDPGADDDEINDAIDELKEEMPHLFKSATDGDDDGEEDEEDSSNGNDRNRRSGPPRSDPGQPKRRRRPSGSTKDQAKSLLHERHPNLVKN